MPIEKQNQSKPRGPDFGRDRAYQEQSHCRAKEGEPRIPEGYLQAHNIIQPIATSTDPPISWTISIEMPKNSSTYGPASPDTARNRNVLIEIFFARVLYGLTFARPTILRSSNADPGGLIRGIKALKPRTKYFATSFIASIPATTNSEITPESCEPQFVIRRRELRTWEVFRSLLTGIPKGKTHADSCLWLVCGKTVPLPDSLP
jgi:hypothetical protein